MEESWVEVNIHLIDDGQTNAFIKEYLSVIIGFVGATSKIYSWHFFREPEIRLRFQVDDKERVERKITDHLSELQKKREFVSHFIFGQHGHAGQEYNGEETIWKEMWPTAKKLYQYTSELALALFQTDGDVNFFLRRYVHLFFDQLGYEQYQESATLAQFSQLAMAAYIKEILMGMHNNKEGE